MKDMKEKTAAAVKFLLLTGAAAYCLVQPEDVRGAVSGAMGRCLGILIPSLYAMLIVSSLLIRSGALGKLSRLLTPLGKIFGMDGEVCGVFLLSIFAGYPVGSRLLAALVSENRLDRRRASLLAGVCFGAGPAFISGCIRALNRTALRAVFCIIIDLASAISANHLFLPLNRFVILPLTFPDSSVRKSESSVTAAFVIPELAFIAVPVPQLVNAVSVA